MNSAPVDVLRGRRGLNEAAVNEGDVNVVTVLATAVVFLIVLSTVDEVALRVGHLDQRATVGHHGREDAEGQMVAVDLRVVIDVRYNVVAQTVVLVSEAVVRCALGTLGGRAVVRSVAGKHEMRLTSTNTRHLPRVAIANASALYITTARRRRRDRQNRFGEIGTDNVGRENIHRCKRAEWRRMIVSH